MENTFDKKIVDDSNNICKNISMLTESNKGLISQNILNGLRNIVEDVIERIYSDIENIVSNDQNDRKKAIKYIKSKNKYVFIARFHRCLESSVSHATLDEENAIRMMQKYYEYMFKLRDFVKVNYKLNIFYNLEDFRLEEDETLQEYYYHIANKLNTITYTRAKAKDRFYIQKKKAFYVNEEIYYQLTIVPCDDYSSKFDRFIAFSKFDVPSYYAIRINFIEDKINIVNKEMPIKIVDNYKVAIRQAEFTKLAKILNTKSVDVKNKEYFYLMDFLTNTGYNLVEIIDFDDDTYILFKEQFINFSTHNIFEILDKCRLISKSKSKGVNIIRYLLLHMRNKIMLSQISDKANNWISYLYIKNECLPFENMPFDASLKEHNPSLVDIFECIDSRGHEGELIARKIRYNSIKNSRLFTPKKDFEFIDNFEEIIKEYNAGLPKKHIETRKLVIEDDKIYINGDVKNCANILENLISRKQEGLLGYKNSVSTWIIDKNLVDCEEKKMLLKDMFVSSNLALIYGSAGTGKTTLIKHIATFFSNESKLFLANTNPAVENLRRQINCTNSYYSTIASSTCLVDKNAYDIVFIDECSTVDNLSMIKLLQKLNCKLLVLVGDIYQIKSIQFGNWFNIARYFLSDVSYELTEIYRNKNKKLPDLWNSVRKLDGLTSEILNVNNYSSEFNDSIFENNYDDEIILCLNYDGLYGINNINRFLQADNPNPSYTWDNWIYKEGDPIIFNENNRFVPVLYNNLKGRIIKINKQESYIEFDIEINIAINEFSANSVGLILVNCETEGHSIIKFRVNKYIDDDSRDKKQNEVVPFQVAYAISIHKAQGLEYDSVKILITNEIEELITHNIFYTAITRAREKLRIYWTPQTQEYILNNLTEISDKNDANIIASKYNLIILKKKK